MIDDSSARGCCYRKQVTQALEGKKGKASISAGLLPADIIDFSSTKHHYYLLGVRFPGSSSLN
jgi:hypothetical protein